MLSKRNKIIIILSLFCLTVVFAINMFSDSPDEITEEAQHRTEAEPENQEGATDEIPEDDPEEEPSAEQNFKNVAVIMFVIVGLMSVMMFITKRNREYVSRL